MSQQNEKLLTIDPAHELRFTGPFNRPVVTLMTLTNNTSQTMVFKIKTTAPKRYCVRPNIGKIEPFKSTIVEICLQPFVYDPNEKNKHKFMVQSVLTENEDLSDLNKLWKELEPEELMDAKLKCVFEMPTVVNTTVENSGSAKNDNVQEDVVNYTEEEQVYNSQKAQPNLHREIELLHAENDSLRDDNTFLQEQNTRLRAAAKQPITEPYTPVMAEKQIPVFYIAIAIAAAILGLLLGKYLL